MDIQSRVSDRNKQIERKHDVQKSNVDLTHRILREYRSLKQEEGHLKQAELKDNLEKERDRIRELKERIMAKESVKSTSISQFRVKQLEL